MRAQAPPTHDRPQAPRPEPRWSYKKNDAGLPLRQRSLPVQEYALICAEGPHKGARLRLNREFVHIGREHWCDLPLENDRRASRHHCELQITEAGVRARDLGSSNGTFIEDLQIYDALLPTGKRLHVGESSFALQLQKQKGQLLAPLCDDSGCLVGQSPHMRRLFSLLRCYGGSLMPVFLHGEPGTGKGRTAQALHWLSPRAQGPFVRLDLQKMLPSQLEAALFGFVAGAFPDAHTPQPGALARAHQGTLYLNGIEALPLWLQPTLLEALRQRQVRPIGSEQPRPADIRLLTSSPYDLQWFLEEKQLEFELYHTLTLAECSLPPLDQRREDIPLLIEYLLKQLRPQLELQLTPRALRDLQHASWPGHIRQLRQVLEDSVGALHGTYIDRGDLRFP